jgi:tryptophan synthase alpha subunit
VCALTHWWPRLPSVIATAEAYLYHAASEGTTGIKRRQFLELAAEKYMVAIRSATHASCSLW